MSSFALSTDAFLEKSKRLNKPILVTTPPIFSTWLPSELSGGTQISSRSIRPSRAMADNFWVP
eukprot:1193715-Pyramimonas_sp.AAC.1